MMIINYLINNLNINFIMLLLIINMLDYHI
jgi:hypothetical protein